MIHASRHAPRALVTAAAFTLLIASSALAANRYVDNSGSPRCSDSSSFGTEAAPWCTIGYALRQIAGGDDLYVKAGTYNEMPYIPGPAGTATNPTVIRAYPGDIVTIRGGGNSGRVKIASTRYLTFEGFVVTNFNQGIFVDASDHITIKNCTVHDVGQEGIHVRQNSSYITIQGCAVYNTKAFGGDANGEGVYVGTGSAGPLDNTHHVTVSGNSIHDVTDEGIDIKPGTHDIVVENNTIFRTGTDWASGGSNFGFGIEIEERDLGVQTWSGNPNQTVRGNLVYNQVGNAIRMGTGGTVYNNVVYGVAAGRYSILVNDPKGDGYTRFIYHNTIDNAASAAVKVQSGVADIRNNIGPGSSNHNLAFSASYFVNATGHDYHLAAGSAAIDAGVNLTSIVTTDKDGQTRSVGSAPDVGAYEYGKVLTAPAPPTNVRIIGGGS